MVDPKAPFYWDSLFSPSSYSSGPCPTLLTFTLRPLSTTLSPSLNLTFLNSPFLVSRSVILLYYRGDFNSNSKPYLHQPSGIVQYSLLPDYQSSFQFSVNRHIYTSNFIIFPILPTYPYLVTLNPGWLKFFNLVFPFVLFLHSLPFSSSCLPSVVRVLQKG